MKNTSRGNEAKSAEQNLAWEFAPLYQDIMIFRCLNIACSKDSKYLAWPEKANDNETILKVLDLDTLKPVEVSAPNLHQGWHSLAFLPGSYHIVYLNHAKRIQIWDIAQNENVAVFGEGFSGSHIAVSTKGELLAGIVDGTAVSIWRLNERRHWLTLRPERSGIESMAWSNKGDQLAIGMADGGLCVWDLELLVKHIKEHGISME